jgi:4-amino-4-deoxy-L-arabinose transferase-like glycosyltransferase
VNLAVLLSLTSLLLFVGLGSTGLTDRDEGRNAEAGREMLETGDWITPTFNYEPRFYKPVLLYWLMSGSYAAFGVDEFAARFPSAFFGTALILLQYWFLSRCRDAQAGLFGALMLLLNIEMIGLNRMALTDSVLVFFTTLAQMGFWMGFHGEGRTRHWLWCFYGGMALATLAKGPVGFIVPMVTIALYLSLTRKWGQFWRRGFPLAGTGLFILLALPWYAAMLAIHGSTYVTIARAQTVGRFLAPMEGHGFGVFFYVPVLLLGFFPWSALLPMALHHVFTGWRASRKIVPGPGTESSELHFELFAALWVIGAFVFFTLSSTRLQHYIAPLFPAAAILAACAWHRSLLDPAVRGARAAIHLMMGLGLLLAVGFASIPWLYSRFLGKMLKEFPAAGLLDPSAPAAGPHAAALILLIGMALVGYFGLHESRRAGAFWAAGATLALVALIVLQFTLPLANRYFIAPAQELAYAAGVNLGPSDQLIMYGATRPSAAFYAKRKIVFIPQNEEDRLRSHLGQSPRTMILLPESFLERLPAEARRYQPILKRFGYLLLSSEPMVSIPERAMPPAHTRIPGH